VLPDASDERFDPPHATANVGLITGGVATNVIADSCAFEWEARTRTVEEMEQVRTSWRRLVDEVLDGSQKLRVETELVTDVPGLQSEHNGEAARIVCAAMGRDGTTTAPFVTEGGIYDSVGIPSIVCGPGAIEEAHQTNEKLSLASLEEYGAGLERLLEESLLL